MNTISQAASVAEKRTNARYWIVVMLFIVTSFNYGDRATLSIAGSEMAKDIGLDAIGMGYVFSAFSWAYVIGQIPGGWLLDKFGSKRVYFWSIFIWSLFTLLQGFVDIFSGFGISFVWLKVIHEPNNHPGVNKKELEYIEDGWALINMDQKQAKEHIPMAQKWGQIKQLIGSRMMIGIYIGQYCINALTYFFMFMAEMIHCCLRHNILLLSTAEDTHKFYCMSLTREV